jgi:hypothetical protein
VWSSDRDGQLGTGGSLERSDLSVGEHRIVLTATDTGGLSGSAEVVIETYLPVRQWVLSVPKRLRPFLHQTPEVASAVLGIFLRGLRATLRDASPGSAASVRDAPLGAISFPQRFGSSGVR